MDSGLSWVVGGGRVAEQGRESRGTVDQGWERISAGGRQSKGGQSKEGASPGITGCRIPKLNAFRRVKRTARGWGKYSRESLFMARVGCSICSCVVGVVGGLLVVLYVQV